MVMRSVLVGLFSLFLPVMVNAQAQIDRTIQEADVINKMPSVAETLLKQGLIGGSIPIVGIDMEYDKLIHDESVRNGNDALLLLYTKLVAPADVPKSNPLLTDLTFVASEEALVTLDDDRNGRIGDTDLTFHYLFVLIFYNHGASYRIVPLKDIGVRAIILSKDLYKDQVMQNNNDFVSSSNYVVMADGSQRTIASLNVKETTLRILKAP